MVYLTHMSQPQNGISISLAVFAGLTNVTNRQTDRARCFVCSNRLHLAIAVTRPDDNVRISIPLVV